MTQKALLFSSVFLVLLGCAQKPVEPTISDDRKKPGFGIKFASEPVCFEQTLENGSRCGLKMEVVFPFMAASRAGLQTNDILVEFQGEKFGSLKSEDVGKFTTRLGKLKIGEVVRFRVLRSKQMAVYQIGQNPPTLLQTGELPPLEKLQQSKEKQITAQWTQTQEVKNFDIKVEGRNWHFGDQAPVAYFEQKLPKESSLKKQMDQMVLASGNQNLQTDVTDLNERFQDMALQADRRRLPVVSYLQNNPTRIQDIQNLQMKAASRCSKVWQACLELIETTGLKLSAAEELKVSEPQTPIDYLRFAEKAYRQSQSYLDKAFATLSSSEKEYLKTHAQAMTEKFSQMIYLHEDANQFSRLRDLTMMNIMQKIDLSALVQSLIPYRQLFDNPVIFEKLRKHPDRKKEIVASHKTSIGTFVIGGSERNDYTAVAGAKDTVFILDLGGDDFYPDISANIIDLDGNDVYEASMPWTLAAGILNARMLVDFNGDDIYQCSYGCLGSSLFGASLFMDMTGDDQYTSQQYALGTSWAGVSVFMDFSGDDNYRSTMLSQGVGIAGGLGLMMDFNGTDRYFSKGANPSSYRDPGQFDGWSQGMGLGLRNFVSGGWGFLYDSGNGKNRFESGTFSQGGGYYFGLGTLINASKSDDTYVGARYSQGFSAHFAIGNFLEVEGHDSYWSPSDVGEGMAWDLSLTLFEDRKGNDQYQTCAHCLGMGSQNSFAFFIESAGRDTYRGKNLPFTGKHYNDYHGGKSFGLFWDQGGAQDQYLTLKNNETKIVNEWQILKDE